MLQVLVSPGLLHTIILGALKQYMPDELRIYLVDFKRGVEFKIYADYELPAFKVIAIESEREFGYNILLALEREQKIRANLFKKNHVDRIEEYRDGEKKLPRILVIMDEFHELFSNANDEFAKKSAMLMERIVRQGRAFGIHLILASQSYSNITGVDKAVFDQMAVRIVLKCSKSDANLLLDNGSAEIDQISIDDPDALSTTPKQETGSITVISESLILNQGSTGKCYRKSVIKQFPLQKENLHGFFCPILKITNIVFLISSKIMKVTIVLFLVACISENRLVLRII